ncbi:hypothetical protein [Actinomadura rugatobispora]|uniref:Uncharacterized protein n=1 Tax=Actinomadura rugatobispora TaxID=1994 RepID=A0ABW1A9I1_9ACTN|nr:hypothetical protein GCM10010200_003750 [Actinomadura rugatobispora]
MNEPTPDTTVPGDDLAAFRGLLATPDSDLAGTFRDGLRLLARALDHTALLHPGDPGAEPFTRVRAVLGGLLDDPAEPVPAGPAPPPAAVAEPAPEPAPDPVAVLLDRFHADRAVREHLGDIRRQDDPARQWIAFNCALLRLPRKTAESWREQAARAVPAAPDAPAPLLLPALDSEEDLLLPWPDQGIRGVRTAVGAAPVPEVAQALAPVPPQDPTGKALTALASQVLAVAELDPEALYFESLTPQPRPLAQASARADHTRELLTRLAAYPAALRDGPSRALEALVAIDEALCSVAHLPPAADPASWWNGLASRAHELVFALAAGLPGRARVREPARRFRDVRDLTEDDVPMVSQAHPGRVIWCLRLYSEIDGVPRRGRVIYGVDR